MLFLLIILLLKGCIFNMKIKRNRIKHQHIINLSMILLFNWQKSMKLLQNEKHVILYLKTVNMLNVRKISFVWKLIIFMELYHQKVIRKLFVMVVMMMDQKNGIKLQSNYVHIVGKNYFINQKKLKIIEFFFHPNSRGKNFPRKSTWWQE